MVKFSEKYPRIRRLRLWPLSVYVDDSLFRRGVKINDDLFGVYSFCGKQGYGKTYFVFRWVWGWFDPSVWKIYSNVKSMKGFDYTYENDLDVILENREKNVIFVIDELAKKVENNPRYIDKVITWLGQSRKHNRIVIITAQEWLMIDHRIRWFVRRNVDVQPVFSTSFPIRRLVWGDAENITYDQLESGYVCPIVSTEYAKIIPKLANLYETREAIE